MARYRLSLWMIGLALLAFLSIGWSVAPDWPQWRGPDRTGLSKETGILKSWPASGPKVLWRAESGDGYSGMSVVDGKLYTMYGIRGEEVLVCLNAATGKEIWRYTLDSSKYRNQFGDGPRATPTIDGNLVFAISGKGKLHTVNAQTGKKVWSHDLPDDYGAKIPTWGVATSPLVYKHMLLVDVGGDDYGLVAFNKNNGEVIWKTKTDLPGYSSPILITVNGVEQVIFFTGTAAISVSPKDGKQYWSHTWRTSYDVNAATPIFIEPDKVFISSGYNVGAALLKVNVSGSSVSVEEVWKSQIMRNHFSSSLLFDDHLYGFDEGTLKCIDPLTQEEKWAVRRTQGGESYGKGSLTYADGHLIVLSEKGNLVLVEATPKGYNEKAAAQVLQGRCWTVPTLDNGKLYVRNQSEMLCLDFASKS